MHWSSYKNVRRFVTDYLAEDQDRPLNIADIGSMDVDLVGSYRTLFDAPNWRYQGVDLAPGANVDLVLRDPYRWVELKRNSLDVVVSGQALEHIEYFWLTFLEIHRVLKPGGICCVVAPSGGPEHRYPVDCWRFYPDGFRALARYAGLEVLEVYAQWDDAQYPERDPIWNDCVLIARKPRGWRNNVAVGLRRWVNRIGGPRWRG
jgi:SAM-dependent methyltransferase